MQGFNMGRYVPPEHEGLSSGNALSGKHPLGARARKSAQGILTVRFEMPFAIWCLSCPKPTLIGQGVRFNAEKQKVGQYHSTPVYSFRMRHNVCGGGIEIRTDPKNTEYVVREGARRRDYGEGKDGGEEIRVMSEGERERLRGDAFAALEVKVDDRRKQHSEKARIEELQDVGGRGWEDPYAASKKLRRAFRADRKAREGREKIMEALRERMGLGIELLDENEEDRRRAGFVEFGVGVKEATSKPLFAQPEEQSNSNSNSKKAKGTKGDVAAQQLRKELGNNTRAAMDPFLSSINGNAISPIKTKHSTILRKKDPNTTDSTPPDSKPPPPSLLVDYDSD
ncbi:MAG: hypothetical protein Q9195_009029 [Heterodermia aff. obscurata]